MTTPTGPPETNQYQWPVLQPAEPNRVRRVQEDRAMTQPSDNERLRETFARDQEFARLYSRARDADRGVICS